MLSRNAERHRSHSKQGSRAKQVSSKTTNTESAHHLPLLLLAFGIVQFFQYPITSFSYSIPFPVKLSIRSCHHFFKSTYEQKPRLAVPIPIQLHPPPEFCLPSPNRHWSCDSCFTHTVEAEDICGTDQVSPPLTDETPPRPKRRKIGTACEPCRNRKSCCDGERPVCGSCRRRAHPQQACVFGRQVEKEAPERYFTRLAIRGQPQLTSSQCQW